MKQSLGTAEQPRPKSQYDSIAISNLIKRVIVTRREDGDIWPFLLSQQVCEYYESQDIKGRAYFLQMLAKDFNVDHTFIQSAIQRYETDPSPKSVLAVREVLVPPFEKFISRINQLPGGMKFLVQMRADILSLSKSKNNLQDGKEKDNLHLLNMSLKNKLQDWFGMGFLDLEKISWQSGANILEKIIKNEAVHPISSWDELKKRLGPSRLCYAFFHRGMPQEPLAFVHVALMKNMPRCINEILVDHPSSEIATAIFYSISSTQKGLASIELGNFLIKRVISEIQLLYPDIKKFCTLSPVPGFRNWLMTNLNTSNNLLVPKEIISLQQIDKDPLLFKKLLENGSYLDEHEKILEPILLRLCSRYLLLEKKRGFCLDPVANFHIRNGARLSRLNWKSDLSEKGISQSFGIMVNYYYILSEIETNNQSYLLDGRISLSEPVDKNLEWAYNFNSSNL